MNSNSETILVVDDNPQIADFLSGELLPSLGYHTVVAKDGKTALKLLKNCPIALMLLDMQLPDLTGLDILRQLSDEGRRVPAILVTAHGSEQIAADAFRLGVQDYLPKPLDADSLNTAISRALAESRLMREREILTAQLKGQVSWLKALSKVGQSVTSTLELDEVLRRIVEAGVHLTHAEEGFLALLDGENQQLYLRAVKNIDQEKSKTLRLPVNDTLVGRVLQTRRPYRTAREAQAQPLKVSTGFLVHSLIHVPLVSRGKALGVLSVDNQANQQEFTERDETILLSLADYAAVAIENACLYEQAQQEISVRKRAEQALRESEKRYELAVRGANDGLWDWDLQSNQIYYSPRWKAMLGFGEDEIANDPAEWFNRVHPSDLEHLRMEISAHINGTTPHFENEHRMLHKDGTYRWMLTRGLAVRATDSLAYRMAGSQTDITLRKNAEEKLLHDAFHDALTGLPNRTLFVDRLTLAIERAKRRKDYNFAVLFLDLDRFKDINDSLGHTLGDQLLIATAKMLEQGLRTTDTVARLGGDEFVILLDEVRDDNAATRVAHWIKKGLGAPFNISGHEILVTTSIGIVFSTVGYQCPEDVLRDADIALYYAKANGKSRHEIFEPAMRERVMERLALESELRQAIEGQELRVFYQPIVSLEKSQMIGFEALARWQHPRRGLLTPKEFIPLAEETGLIIPIDHWVLREACQQMREWQQRIPQAQDLTVSVNLSGKEVTQPDLLAVITQILQETGLKPDCLKLEMTESAIMENNLATTDVFKGLQGLGVQIQIDDFGVGYSSLGYLSQFPINALKIDQTFVSKMIKDSNQMKIVQAIVNLTHRLGVGVIAEGVETDGQLVQLKELNCEFGQGYLISKPLDREAADLLLAELYGNFPDTVQ
jgi:diguanylate cyclase (GGDEF)-like protein/PAS domain S-box-containing protein